MMLDHLQEIRILEEGHEYPDGKVLALGSVIWKDEESIIGLYELYTKKSLGPIYNLRREGNFIVGDTFEEVDPTSVTPYLIHVTTKDIDGKLVFTKATLVCVYASQLLQAPY